MAQYKLEAFQVNHIELMYLHRTGFHCIIGKPAIGTGHATNLFFNIYSYSVEVTLLYGGGEKRRRIFKLQQPGTYSNWKHGKSDLDFINAGYGDSIDGIIAKVGGLDVVQYDDNKISMISNNHLLRPNFDQEFVLVHFDTAELLRHKNEIGEIWLSDNSRTFGNLADIPTSLTSLFPDVQQWDVNTRFATITASKNQLIGPDAEGHVDSPISYTDGRPCPPFWDWEFN